ncbi:MAG: electron transport complex subunit RsxC [Chloroflexota bacterium]
MEKRTFAGGAHPHENKDKTAKLPIEAARMPSRVIIPLSQHVGAPCEPLVKVGDTVAVGQKIGDSQAFVSAPVNASVSGKVTAIEPLLSPGGANVMSIVIESDGLDTIAEGIAPRGDLASLSADEIKAIIREAGIVGMGGAGFPTHVKVAPPKDKKVDVYIINAAECEPYVTCDHRLMLERPQDIVLGFKALMKAAGVTRGYIGIEDNKPDAIESMLRAVANESGISVVALKTKYPQGGEKQLINAITGRVVPSGGLPADVGVLVSNVSTAVALADALQTGMPVIERTLTVTGPIVSTPRNLRVRIGTSFADLVEQCGGLTAPAAKVISGGPMMGIAQSSLDVPVAKGTSCILVLGEADLDKTPTRACIRCARCVDACPMHLMPIWISQYAERDMYEEAAKLNAVDCIECGTCAYVCPSRRPLVEAIRVAKRIALAKRKK